MFALKFAKAIAYSWRVAFVGFPQEPAPVELPPIPSFMTTTAYPIEEV